MYNDYRADDIQPTHSHTPFMVARKQQSKNMALRRMRMHRDEGDRDVRTGHVKYTRVRLAIGHDGGVKVRRSVRVCVYTRRKR